MSYVAAGTAAVSLAGQVFGSIKASKEAKKQQALINQRQAENKADYDLTANKSFLDTAAAKDVVKQQKDALIDGTKQIAGRAAITGASDEAKIAGQTGVQKNYSDTISRLAGAGTQYQLQNKSMYLARQGALDGQQMQLDQQKADSAANLTSNAGDLLGSAANIYAMKGGTTAKTGGLNRPQSVTDDLNKIAKSTPKPSQSAPKGDWWSGGSADESIQKRQGN